MEVMESIWVLPFDLPKAVPARILSVVLGTPIGATTSRSYIG
jgi:hypothetical protein